MAESRCTRCILPASLPGAKLDENGVCLPCRRYEADFGNWEKVRDRRKLEFEQALRRAKKLKRPYDCLIPLSGGKDSTYALYVCARVHGLRCLGVTFDNGYLSDHARQNIRRALDRTGADHLTYSVSRDHMLELYRLFLQKAGDLCSVCMRGIGICTAAARKAFDIPLIVDGNGRRLSYVAALRELFQPTSQDFVRNVLDGEELRAAAFPVLDSAPARPQAPRLIRLARRVRNRILRPFRPRTLELFDYLDIPREQMLEELKREMGWTRPADALEHMDCRLHQIPFHIHSRKFPELTPATLYRCGQVRRGELTREEALRADEEDLADPKTPPALGPFLEEIGLSEDEFQAAVGDWTRLDRFR
jgi:hypothetical protein